jgi:acetyl-CoA C-acetyltransferase
VAYKKKPGVIGCAIRPMIAGRERSLEEIMYDTAQLALADAGITIEDIDGIVVASNDQFDGRSIAVMMASGSVGGVDRDILSTPSASEHAFVLGALRVASGQYRTQLIVSWSPTEVSSMAEAQRLGADPYFHRALPLDEVSAHALQASALEHQVAGLHAVAAAVADKNRAHGRIAYPDVPTRPPAGPARWPLTAEMISAPVTGCVALVLATEEFVAERGVKDVAWLRGMGWATEAAFLGDRILSTAPALVEAARQAYEAAGIHDPAAEIDVVEITDATTYAELLAYEALALCNREDWAARVTNGFFARTGKMPVNLSGGVLTFNPVFCTGLIRIAEVANQVRGRAGAHQLENVRTGLAHAGSGFAMQYQAAIVLGRAPEHNP